MDQGPQAIVPRRVLLLDLGDTLEHGGVRRPNAAEALAVISGFRTSSGEPLEIGLVSDYTMPAPDATPGEIERLFAEYTEHLNRLGLARYFQPVERRITLSTQAGVRKPDRAVFELALARLGVAPRLDACVFVTEDAAHVAACGGLGMRALRFGPGGGLEDWSAGPLVIARVFGIQDQQALLPALDLRLEHRFGFRLSHIDSVTHPDDRGGMVSATVDIGIDAPAPLHVSITLAPSGDVASLAIDGSPVDMNADAERFVRMLEDNRRIAPGGGDLPPGATHTLEPGPEGDLVVRRRRFSIS